MQVTENVKYELGKLIKDKFEGNVSVSDIVEYLFDTSIINPKMCLRYLIRSEYYVGIKDQGKSCDELKHDLANKYDVEYDFVKDAIYKYKHLQI